MIGNIKVKYYQCSGKKGLLMNPYYEKIMALKEAEEFKKIVRRWQTLSENIEASPTDAPILLPDMLWVARSGVGKTNLLRLASEYLASLGNLMNFCGDTKYVEFLLSYCPPNAHFHDMERLLDAITVAAGFRSEFRGIVHVDINEWLDHFEERHFISFMELMAERSDKWLVVLSVYSDKKDKLHNLMAFLSMYLRIEQVQLSLPKTADLFEYIERNLGAYGLSLSRDARELLHASIEKIRRNKYFDGFKTIKILCQDIVYSVYSQRNLRDRCLTAEMLADFSADSEYVRRTVANIARVNEIGLLKRGARNEQ